MDLEKELYQEEKEPVLAESSEKGGEKSAAVKSGVSDSHDYFTNINGIYAKDVDGRAETAELRTLVTRTYSETVLWEWQSSSDSHADAILSASFLAFDALMLISNAKAFLEGSFAENDGEGYTATVSVSELVRHSGGTIVLGGSDVSGNSYVKYSFDTSSPTAITHKSHGSGSWAQTLRTVIGIKY